MLCAAAMLSALTACIDDNIVDPDAPGNGTVTVSLRLVLPSGETVQTRAGGTGTQYGELDDNTTYQKYIGDIWILVFSKNESGEMVFDGLVENLKPDNNQGDQTRTVEGTYRKTSDKVEIAVLTNLAYNLPKAPRFNEWKGLTERVIYEKLVYDYPEEGLVLDENRFLPMWGKAENVSLDKERNEASLSLYRAVAKMGVKVDTEQCKTFTLEKVYVYYDNNSGYCAAPHVNPNQTVNRQYEAPDVPASASSFDIGNPQVYTVTGNITMEQIYLSEVRNKGNDGNRMKVVVGGHYAGEGLVQGNDLSYYRIDMEDTYDEGHSTNVGTMTPFDIIRNHSYIFNITGVDNPGTPTPDKALDSDVAKVKVRIEQYADEPMRGVSDQYTLTTDRSVIEFESSKDITPQELNIWTDYALGWTIESISEGTPIPDWVVIDKKYGDEGVTTTVKINPDAQNHSITRTGRFYVCAGTIKKEITVIQPQPPTANCYVAGPAGNPHTLIVGIKGNGTEGTMPEGKPILEKGSEVTLEPAYIAVIWETHQGLVELINPADKNPVKNVKDHITGVQYDRKNMSIQYNVNTNEASIGGVTGGNALIGAFDSKGKIIWSWHIWVSPDIVNPTTQTVNEDYVENWKVNDYDVMDRNLGALSNRPNNSLTVPYGEKDNKKGVAAMGLLYQWGRKDPFIGPDYSNDDFTGKGLIDVIHYYKEWEAQKVGNNGVIQYTIENPTILIYGEGKKGLSGMADNGGYLWGTDKGFDPGVIELGSKTIYDPCPVGYRVPPVNTFVFTKDEEYESEWNSVGWKGTEYSDVYMSWSQSDRRGRPTGNPTNYKYFAKVNTRDNRPNDNYTLYKVRANKSSLYYNWNENLRYIPHSVNNNGKKVWQLEQFINNYEGKYVPNAKYYGFYINHKEIDEPASEKGSMYDLLNDDKSKISWFPLTGAYDPTKGVTFRDGSNTISIQQGSTITVNSFLWTNSSVNNGGNRIPAAMFLHGTEYGGGGSGRHIHGMTQDNIKAEPHYAGAVRCIKDRAKNEWKENSLTDEVYISRTKGSTTEITIVSVASDWMLTDPGAPWVQVTPDRGGKTSKAGQKITLKMLSDQNPGTRTVLTFRIANEKSPRKVTVIVGN
jgi:hypothetical protein